VHLHFFGPATLGMDFEQILTTQVEPQFYPVAMYEFRSRKSFHNINENMFFYFEKGSQEPLVGHTNNTEAAKGKLAIYTMKYYFHPKDGSYIYRVEANDKKLVFATDVEGYAGSDQRLVNFSKDADILIHDAQYSEEQYKNFSGYGHSNAAMAGEAAKQANVKKLLLFHHDPNNSDEDLKLIQKRAREIFPQSELATEKWEWKL
jgi:ribonuclease BN (tRNA processing enzyme)